MNVKKCLVLFLAICLSFSVLSLVVAAEDTTATKDTFLLGFTLGEFISLAIAAALLLLIIVLCIVKRKKLVEALRAYRSEMKKITWFSWKNVVRCTVFVLVAVVAIAAVVGVLDFVFFQFQRVLTEMK
jgi:preprotein translocase SecE subunit